MQIIVWSSRSRWPKEKKWSARTRKRDQATQEKGLRAPDKTLPTPFLEGSSSLDPLPSNHILHSTTMRFRRTHYAILLHASRLVFLRISTARVRQNSNERTALTQNYCAPVNVSRVPGSWWDNQQPLFRNLSCFLSLRLHSCSLSWPFFGRLVSRFTFLSSSSISSHSLALRNNAALVATFCPACAGRAEGLQH